MIFFIWYYSTNQSESISFDVVYMNLDSSVHRARHMKRLLKVVGVKNHRRFRAVDGKQLYKENSYLKSFSQAENIRFDISSQKAAKVTNKQAQTSTWLSYLLLFKDFAASSSNQPLLILEDDIDLEIDFVKLLGDSMKQAPNDWDILLCGYCCLSRLKSKPFRSKMWIPVKHFATTHCFVLRNSTVASFIASQIDVKVVEDSIDLFIARMASSNKLNIYARAAKIAGQRRDIFGSNNRDSGKILEKDELNNSTIKFLSKLSKRN